MTYQFENFISKMRAACENTTYLTDMFSSNKQNVYIAYFNLARITQKPIQSTKSVMIYIENQSLFTET